MARDTVHIFDKPTSRVELLGQEQGGKIGASAPEQRDAAAAIAGNEARNHGHFALIQHPFDGSELRADRFRVVGSRFRDELNLAGIEYLCRNAKAIEFES
jgi:hypothetical protein